MPVQSAEESEAMINDQVIMIMKKMMIMFMMTIMIIMLKTTMMMTLILTTELYKKQIYSPICKLQPACELHPVTSEAKNYHV